LDPGYVDEVVIGCRGEIIARHPRCWAREDVIFDPLHYLPLIEEKINSLDQAAPLLGWQLPDEFATLRRLMEGRMYDQNPGRQANLPARKFTQVLSSSIAADNSLSRSRRPLLKSLATVAVSFPIAAGSRVMPFADATSFTTVAQTRASSFDGKFMSSPSGSPHGGWGEPSQSPV